MTSPLRLIAIVVAAVLVASVTAPASAAGRKATSVRAWHSGSSASSVVHVRDARITASARQLLYRHARGQARRSSRLASSVLWQVNRLRRTGTRCAGKWHRPVPRLRHHGKLAFAARLYAVRMAVFRFFGHIDRVTGQGPGDRVTATGYDWSHVGENVAAGYRTPRAVVRAWKRSPSHCRNLMDPRWRHMGVGWHYGGRDSRWGHYWGQLFARPAS